MRAIIPLLFLFLFPTVVHALEIFESGEIATAKAFNDNFSELDGKINQLQNSHGWLKRVVNGVEMRVSSARYGNYGLQTDKGVSATINEDGYPVGQFIYYEQNNCTGDAYYSVNFTDNKSLNHLYVAKRLSPRQVAYDGSQLLMTDETEVVKLHSQSRRINGECSNTKTTEIAFKLIANDQKITGFPNNLPYVIQGNEVQLKLTKVVGSSSSGGTTLKTRNVYANGTKIGTVNYLPKTASHSLSGVSLTGYEGFSVTLYKDGSYTGLNLIKEDEVSFISAGCTGTPYLEVLDNFDQKWWYSDRLNRIIIKNNGKFYQQSEQLYKMSAGAKSERWNSGSCFSRSGTKKNAYRRLTETSAPDMPTFTAPITWDDFVPVTEYGSLPEAN